MGDYAFQRVKKTEKYLAHTSATEGCMYHEMNLSKMEG
jgi:hypothetical protein